MHFEAAWHAEGLRWIAGVLEDVAEYLDRPGPEAAMPCAEPDRIEHTRLRVHLRGFQ